MYFSAGTGRPSVLCISAETGIYVRARRFKNGICRREGRPLPEKQIAGGDKLWYTGRKH